jgi:Ca-activated chloride channel family protein
VIVPPVPGRCWAARLAAILAGLGACLQTSPVAFGQFTGGVSLVEVYVTVTDHQGRPITGLVADDFAVDENGVRQTIDTFASAEIPLAVAIGIDRSFSITPAALAAFVTATRTFIDGLSHRDQSMLLGIGSEAEVIAPLSSDSSRARVALERLDRWGTTPLYDAVADAIDAVQPATGRRALVLLSDGVDRYSRVSEPEIVEYARRHDVQIYPVTIGAQRPPIWSEVAAASGGRSFHIRESRELTSVVATIGNELRHQYLLGYRPADKATPGWRSIHVRINRTSARIRAREGYLVPVR